MTHVTYCKPTAAFWDVLLHKLIPLRYTGGLGYIHYKGLEAGRGRFLQLVTAFLLQICIKLRVKYNQSLYYHVEEDGLG